MESFPLPDALCGFLSGQYRHGDSNPGTNPASRLGAVLCALRNRPVYRQAVEEMARA